MVVVMRPPWFSIIEVIEPRGRSMHDIASGIAARHCISMALLRGQRRSTTLFAVRKKIYQQIKIERPDLSSGAVARFMNRDGSSVRHAWLQMDRAA